MTDEQRFLREVREQREHDRLLFPKGTVARLLAIIEEKEAQLQMVIHDTLQYENEWESLPEEPLYERSESRKPWRERARKNLYGSD